NRGTATQAFLTRFQSDVHLPEPERTELFARYEQILECYACASTDMVSCHNDLFKPDNILFDGDRLWLVDWEAAFLNDRYADLAVVANLLGLTADEELPFLERYLGAPAHVDQVAKLFLMRQLAHAFYAMAFLFIGSRGASIDWNEPLPDANDLRQCIWQGDGSLADPKAKNIRGRSHLKEFLNSHQRH
ncbi:MAG: phosphotransferase, partial [Chloroflexia bacterium]